LHACPVRIGKPRSLLESSEVLSVVRRLAKVMTRHPAHLERAVAMVRQMEELAEDTVDGLLVQTHGQYRPIHVFISDSSVAVIDLDRSRPCDPSRDVAEFVHRLRVMMYRDQGTVERAEAPTRAFLETYASEIPDRSYLTNLRFHWSRYVFHSLSKELKDSESTDLESDPSVAFYRSEFENVIQDRYGLREA
jgi:aminoglycoside phosphotransferase (APT) family kinase protein